MRAQRYLIVAAGQRVYAPTLEELAEIALCAMRAGDQIEFFERVDPGVVDKAGNHGGGDDYCRPQAINPATRTLGSMPWHGASRLVRRALALEY